MQNEIKRRLMTMGLPTDEGLLCFTAGLKTEPTDVDKAAIDHIKKCGGEVYLITKDVVYGVPMCNYVYVGDAEEEWKMSFGQVCDSCYATTAFISSELTHDTYDVGTITLYCVGGSAIRTA